MSETERCPRPLTRYVVLPVVGLAVCLLTACGGSDVSSGGTPGVPAVARADRGYVGTVSGTDAFIAVVAGGGQAVVYVCDGDEDLAEWFKGPIGSDDRIDLTNDRGARVMAGPIEDLVGGSVTLADGGRHSFSATPATGRAGLYQVIGDEATAAGVVAGWIVDNHGAERGSLRLRGVRQPVPALPGPSLRVAGTSLPVVVFLIGSNVPAGPATPPGVPIPYPNIAIGDGGGADDGP